MSASHDYKKERAGLGQDLTLSIEVPAELERMADYLLSCPKASNFILLPHEHADGDALGSSLALAVFLSRLGHKARVLLGEPISSNLSFLPRADQLAFPYQPETEITEPYIAIMLDANELSRLGDRAKLVPAAEDFLLIDHHQTGPESALSSAHIGWLENWRSSVAEMVTLLLLVLDRARPQRESLLDKDIAEMLLAGIYSDTFGLRYDSSGPDSFALMSLIRSYQPRLAIISEYLFPLGSVNRLRITGYVYTQAKFFADGRVAIACIGQEDFARFGATDQDTEGLCSQLREVEGVSLAILIRQIEDKKFKVSFRSDEHFDVAAMARSFSGGGHRRAAGCTLEAASPAEAERLILDRILP